jgi:hypothetical protein
VGPLTIFCVLKRSSNADLTIIGGAGSSCQYRISSVSQRQQLLKATVTIIGTASTTLNTTNFFTLDLNYDGTTLNFFLNGVADGSPSNAQTLSGNVTNVGSNSSHGERFNGVICELFMYSNVVSSPDHSGLESYLLTKWAT